VSKFRTVTIGADHYDEIKAMADKWVEKEKPYTPTEKKYIRNYDENFTGKCKCGINVYEVSKYCNECGQRLNWED